MFFPFIVDFSSLTHSHCCCCCVFTLVWWEAKIIFKKSEIVWFWLFFCGEGLNLLKINRSEINRESE
jgi:hypothetical protein